MATDSIQFPECCRYCPYRQNVSAACEHELRQLLISEFAADTDEPCPVFNAWYAEEMSRLADELSPVGGG